MLRGYPSVYEADFVIPMETVLGLYSQPYDARYPVICRDEHPKSLRADKRTPQSACPGRPDGYAARHLHSLDVRGAAGPVAHGPRHRPAHRRGLGALGTCPARPLGRVPDPGLRPSEHSYLCLFLPGFSAHRSAPPGPARTDSVYVSARQLAQYSRTGIERPDALDPAPAQAAVHAQVTAWTEARNAAPKGIQTSTVIRTCAHRGLPSVPYIRLYLCKPAHGKYARLWYTDCAKRLSIVDLHPSLCQTKSPNIDLT